LVEDLMTPEELRERRTALGLTQEQLGEIIGKPRNTITRWESGSLAIRDQALLSLALEALERREQECTPSSGNVFADLGLPDAEERLARARTALEATMP
jgi:transcriptional regulator with XRE-family HTH domain